MATEQNTLFKNLNKLKERVKREMLSNQNILKLVAYNTDDPLSEADIDDAQALVNDHIYFNPVVYDDTIQDTRTFILTNMRVSSIRGSQQFANITLYIYVISHNDLYELVDGSVRVWNIADELVQSFHKKFENDIGCAHFKQMFEITSRKDYYAVELQFEFTEFKQ